MFATMTQEKQFITVDGHQIAYITAGDPTAPPLLLVHGWLSHARVWRQTLDALQDQYFLVSIDLLGHGHSDKPRDGDYSIPAQAGRVLAVADALDLEPFTVIGHSMGGQIGLYLGIHAPERIAAIVSVSGVVAGKLSAYVRYVLTPIYWQGALLPFTWNISRALLRYPWYFNIFNYALTHPQFQRPPFEEDEDLQMGIIPGIEIPAYRDLQAIAAVDLTASLEEIAAPTLAIFGREDKTVPRINAELIEQLVPQGRVVWIERCGHAPMIEQPVPYLDALREFLGAL